MISTDFVTLDDIKDLLSYIAKNGRTFEYGVMAFHAAMSILTSDSIRLENGVKYVTYPPYGVYCTIRDIIEKYNNSLELK